MADSHTVGSTAERTLIDIRRLMDVCAAVDVGVTLTDINGYFLEQNEPVRRMLGYTAEELRGRLFSELTHPDDVAHNWELFQELLAGKRSHYSIEKRYIRKNGEIVWARLAVSLFRDAAGDPLVELAVIDDITEQKQTEQALALSRDRLSEQLRREQEARRQAEEAHTRLALLAEAGKVLAGSLDYETTLASVAHLAVTSIADWCVVDLLTEEGGLHRVAAAHVDPEREEWAREVSRRFSRDERGTQAIREGRSSLVSDVTDEMLVAAIQDPEYLAEVRRLGMRSVITVPLLARGHVLGGMTFIAAESGKRYGPEDLALAEELAQRAGLAIDNARLYHRMSRNAAELEAVLGQMADGLAMMDRNGRVVYINEAGRKISGRVSRAPRDPLDVDYSYVRNREGKPFKPDEVPLNRALRGEVVTNAVWRLMRADGSEVVVQGSAAPVRGPDGELLGAVSAFRDITSQIELEAEKDQFLSLVAHELRTPITVIGGYAQLMARRNAAGQPVDAPLAVMNRQLKSLIALIDELLDLSRLQTGKLELHPAPVAYPDLVRAVVDDIAVMHPDRRIDVRVPDSLVVQADPVRVRQVLVNLLDNAAKYGPGDATITVRVVQDERGLVTTVCDGGPALPEEDRTRIFERFYRSPSSNGQSAGLGIGLHLSRAIVEQHGGRIWIVDGETCCFAFSLPVEAQGDIPANTRSTT
jgi:PAS domain S-box-containing protein